MTSELRLDLIVLAADKDATEALDGILQTLPSKGEMRRIRYEIKPALMHDGEARRHAHELLRPYIRQARFALVVFDREGCGAEGLRREEIEQEVLNKLEENGWQKRAEAIVIDPELEAWVWSQSPKVDEVLGWAGTLPTLRKALEDKGWLSDGGVKPTRPREAMKWALLQSKTPWSAALFSRLARQVSYRRCTDQAFAKLLATLRTWFPP